jgi:DNA-binding XRE family transcriptional regulator
VTRLRHGERSNGSVVRVEFRSCAGPSGEERLHAPRKEAQEERVRDDSRLSPARPVRRAAGYTQESLTERICAQYDTVASIEQGRRPLKPNLAAQLDDLLDTKGALAVAVANMPEMDKYPIWAAEFIDREAEAVTLCSYENQVVPGLLQTDGYARATFHNEIPKLSHDEIEHRVIARVERQSVLQNCRHRLVHTRHRAPHGRSRAPGGRGGSGLRVTVLMQNRGLPEAGDAVFTFPPYVLSDPEAYAAAANLPPHDDPRAERAARERRDLAVEGYLLLRDALTAGDAEPLHAFHRAAVRIVAPNLASWRIRWQEGARAAAERTGHQLEALRRGDLSHLAAARAQSATPSRLGGFGMCGRRDEYGV